MKNTLFVNHVNRTIVMDRGRIALDIAGEARAHLTVGDLMRQFQATSGRALDDDRILLSPEKAD